MRGRSLYSIGLVREERRLMETPSHLLSDAEVDDKGKLVSRRSVALARWGFFSTGTCPCFRRFLYRLFHWCWQG